MSATIELLGRQHQEVLARLAAVETTIETGGASGGFGDFLTYLRQEVARHFAIEEHALFPALARHIGLTQGPLAVMNAEHSTFRELVEGLAAGCRSGDTELQRRCTQELIDLLRAHIAKEDGVIFPMALRMLTPDEHRGVDGVTAAVEASPMTA